MRASAAREAETVGPRPERIVMFHGTSSRDVDALLEEGLRPDPPVRLSLLMAAANGDHAPHTESFPGTYLTASRSVAASYARHAVDHMGGDPVVLAVSLPIAHLVPDEDEVLYALACPLALALGWEEGSDERLDPWGPAVAREVADELLRGFGLDDPEASAEVAAALDRMVGAATRGWDGDPDLFDPELNEGWAEPNWVKALVARPGGLAVYRRGMDALCRSMAGADPDRYPCGLESCKGRVLTSIPSADGGDVLILAAGSPMEPFSSFDARHLLTGGELVDLESARWIDAPAPAFR